jgi:hypothetical protein
LIFGASGKIKTGNNAKRKKCALAPPQRYVLPAAALFAHRKPSVLPVDWSILFAAENIGNTTSFFSVFLELNFVQRV